MSVNLFDPPPKFGIPLSRGGDIYLGFTLTVPDPDNPGQKMEVDFPDGSTVTFAITTSGQGSTEVTELAEISGSKAKVLMDHLKIDDLGHDEDQLWRITYTSAEGIDSPVANGWAFRADGNEDSDA